MQINSISDKNNASFKGMWTNKTVLKGLETVSEHGTSFIAATSFVMASGVRPLAIAATPDIKKENREYAITNSIASGAVKFAFVEAIALPIENAIKKTEKNPEKFLKTETIETFKNGKKELIQSKNFKFATQFMKLSTGLITAIPKSMLTVALIPVLNDKLFSNKKENTPSKNVQSNLLNFKGRITDYSAKSVGKILDWKPFQNFAKKFSSKSENIARDMSVATDIILTGSFVNRTIKNKKIEEERKKPLIMNTVYATIASLLGGCAVDSLIKKNTKNFIVKFSQLNKNDPKLSKYIEGINIVRPTLIFAAIYYGILPIITTYMADKSDKSYNRN